MPRSTISWSSSQDLIESYLPEEDKDKLDELVDAQSMRDAMLTEFYYRHGFSDGVMVIVQALMGAG